jgi:hypothetical protein
LRNRLYRNLGTFQGSTSPQPSEKGVPPRDPVLSAPHGHGPQERICSSSWSLGLHSIWKLEPPTNPGRFSPISLQLGRQRDRKKFVFLWVG